MILILVPKSCETYLVTSTGLFVNQKWPELGCSPDGLVVDPSSSDKYGLLELRFTTVQHDIPGATS